MIVSSFVKIDQLNQTAKGRRMATQTLTDSVLILQASFFRHGKQARNVSSESQMLFNKKEGKTKEYVKKGSAYKKRNERKEE